MPNSSSPANDFNKRIVFISVTMCIFVFVVIFKLVYVQVYMHNSYIQKANAQQSRKFVINAKRGQIYVQDGNNELYPIALNQQRYLLAADPKYIKDPNESVDKLSGYLGSTDREALRSKLSDKDQRYVVINKKLSSNEAEEVKKMNIAGVILIPQDGRNYPEGELFSHITGYVNDDESGQYGIEEYMNQTIAGVDGVNRAVTDAQGVPITSNENTLIKPKDGSDLVLTIDRNIQAMAAQALETAVKNNKAENGSIIVMDPKTGAIKAMVNYPYYDPNNYQAVPQDEYSKFLNRSITNLFEPGSGFKVITMSAGIETGKVKPDTKYEDTGESKIDDRVVKNADNKKYGTSSMVDVIQKSLNTGVVFVLKQLGTDPNKITYKSKEVFYDYIKKFGFGERTGIELAGESKGFIKDPDSPDVDYANMSFGQGLSSTSLQLINSVAVVANGGTLYKPYLVDKEITQSGEIKQKKPEVIRDNVISAQTAATVASMMEQVVLKGSGWPARMKGYNIAGKTGTAQVPKADGQGYEESKNIGSFVGFGPVEDPKFVMLVRVDYPKVDGFAEKTAVPAFAEVAKQLFIYYQVPPNGN
ncbi:MAG: penicillin-binding protein 2 [Patescibacteria group bacterium]|nr:penicillin-binding protein 2 [Patescibacteria group bacterium]